MRPSEDVWKNIEKQRARRRRRIGIGSTLFLLTASLFGYFSLNNGPAVSLKPVADRPFTNAPGNRPATPANDAVSADRPATANNNDLAAQPRARRRTTGSRATAGRDGSPLYVAHLADPAREVKAVEENEFTIRPVDAYEPSGQVHSEAGPTAALQPDHDLAPSIENVINSYKPGRRKNKAEWQLFFTPTISYRKLSENKSYLRAMPQGGNPANISALYDVNNVVTHKPDLGLELGFSLKYAVTRSVKLKTGLQFNMNRYDIKVFNNVPEIATIALNTSNGRVNSLNTVTRYRNFGGPQSDWIQNTYYQISSPVGVEVKLRGDAQKQFGIATNIQPTYIIGDRAYLISTDYKNYSQVPWLIRNWNVNTSVEAFVAYSTGSLKWQVGPQVRYQLLSSFRSEYPVKENLFDFGFKVGVALNNK